ncbi:MAG: ABC transporter ATP-binding protein, partial [Pseudonocardiaceae bacterium]
ARRDSARLALEQVGLGDRQKHMPNELSGGQQQRVAIARALINDPTLLLADEPTGNLDTTSSIEIMRLLCALNDAGHTVVIITHEEEVARFAKRVVRMRDGLIESDQVQRSRSQISA